MLLPWFVYLSCSRRARWWMVIICPVSSLSSASLFSPPFNPARPPPQPSEQEPRTPGAPRGLAPIRRGAPDQPLLHDSDRATMPTPQRLQNPRSTFGSVLVKENDTSAGRWYYFREHFYVQFRVHILHTAQTEIISLMCVCTVMWSSFR